MYVRKKHNRFGSTSMVVVSKAGGKYKAIKSFAFSTSEEEIDSLCKQAVAWMRLFGIQQELDIDVLSKMQFLTAKTCIPQK